MSDPKSGPPFPWPEHFAENRDKFPTEELWKLIRHHIAWSWDGTHILAAARTEKELYQKLDESGIDISRVVFDYVDDPDVSLIGDLCAFSIEE